MPGVGVGVGGGPAGMGVGVGGGPAGMGMSSTGVGMGPAGVGTMGVGPSGAYRSGSPGGADQREVITPPGGRPAGSRSSRHHTDRGM